MRAACLSLNSKLYKKIHEDALFRKGVNYNLSADVFSLGAIIATLSIATSYFAFVLKTVWIKVCPQCDSVCLFSVRRFISICPIFSCAEKCTAIKYFGTSERTNVVFTHSF